MLGKDGLSPRLGAKVSRNPNQPSFDRLGPEPDQEPDLWRPLYAMNWPTPGEARVLEIFARGDQERDDDEVIYLPE
jgi:hypothetical protein